MENIIRQALGDLKDPLWKKNRLRELLQELILKIVYEKKYFQDLVFTGGTALRFFHGLRRFSEDLDFSVANRDLAFTELINDLVSELGKYSFMVSSTEKIDGNMKNAFIHFHNILHEYGISGHLEEKLSIKLEIDFNPPAGGAHKPQYINRNFMFYCLVYDLPSLFAGKLHAVCFRRYSKGRDYYDLLFYLGKKIEPDTKFFANAVRQTENDAASLLRDGWKALLKTKLEHGNYGTLRKDVQPFLEDPGESEFIRKDALLGLLEKYE